MHRVNDPTAHNSGPSSYPKAPQHQSDAVEEDDSGEPWGLAIDSGWYDDPNGSGGQRWWDGECWTSRRSPAYQSLQGQAANASRQSNFAKVIYELKKRPLITSAVVVVAVAVVGGVAIFSSDGGRWSEFPHSAFCGISADGVVADWALPPATATVAQVSLSHLGGDRIKMVMSFPNGVPVPGTSYSPYTGQVIDSPGSVRFWINLDGRREEGGGGATVSIFSPRNGTGWSASRGDYEIQKILDKPIPDHPSGNLITDVAVTSNSVTLDLDLEGQPDFFPRGSYTPTVVVNADQQGLPSSDSPDGDFTFYHPQRCEWG